MDTVVEVVATGEKPMVMLESEDEFVVKTIATPVGSESESDMLSTVLLPEVEPAMVVVFEVATFGATCDSAAIGKDAVKDDNNEDDIVEDDATQDDIFLDSITEDGTAEENATEIGLVTIDCIDVVVLFA